MFNLFNREYTTVKVKLNEESQTKMIRLRGLLTYRQSREVTNSDVVAHVLDVVEKQVTESMETMEKGAAVRQGKFVMMVGLPGSGKTSYAFSFAKDDPKSIVISGKDIMRELNITKFDTAADRIVREIMCARALEGLKEGKTMIYDAPDLQPLERKQVLQFLDGYDCEKKCFVMNTAAEICERRSNTENDVLQDLESRRTFYPSYAEGWDEITVITERADSTTEIRKLSPGDEECPWDLRGDHTLFPATPRLEETAEFPCEPVDIAHDGLEFLQTDDDQTSFFSNRK